MSVAVDPDAVSIFVEHVAVQERETVLDVVADVFAKLEPFTADFDSTQPTITWWLPLDDTSVAVQLADDVDGMTYCHGVMLPEIQQKISIDARKALF